MDRHNIIIESTNNKKIANSRSKLKTKQNKNKRSTKTTLLTQQNNQNDDFGLKSKSKLQKVLTQSTQQLQTLYLFKNTEIKKSIQIENNQQILKSKKNTQNKNILKKSSAKQNKDKQMYRTNNMKTLRLRQNQYFSIKKKANKKSKHKSPVIQQERRMQKLKSSCIKMLKQKQQEKQSELQTLKIMHVLQEAELLGGQVFSKQQKKRLIRIHQIQTMIKVRQIGEVQVQIEQIIQQNHLNISNQYLNEGSWI